MNLTVRYVANTHTAQMWPRIEKYIQEAMKYGYGDYTIDQIRLLINTGQWLLIVLWARNNSPPPPAVLVGKGGVGGIFTMALYHHPGSMFGTNRL
jgi:hypothetical protein